MSSPVRLLVNGQIHAIEVPDRRLLSDALRDDCRLHGNHAAPYNQLTVAAI